MLALACGPAGRAAQWPPPRGVVEELVSPASQVPAADSTGHRDGHRRPSPPWYGGVAALMFFASFGWVAAYALGPLPGQGALGGWNYAVTVGLFAASVVMIRFWRAD